MRRIYILPVMFPPRHIIMFLAAVLLVRCTPPLQSEKETDPIEEISFSYLQDDAKIFVGAKVKATYRGIAVNYVSLKWFGKSGIDAVSADEAVLSDNGDLGDILKGDHTYSKKLALNSLSNTLAYEDTGNVHLSILAYYMNDSVYTFSDTFALGNIVPRFLSLEAPDTLTLPDSGLAQLITIRAEVEDADGLDDIQWVGFTSKRLSDGVMLNDGNYIFMVDTGDSTYGDQKSNDGIFSTNVTFPYNASTGNLQWKFRVQDWSNDFTDSTHIVHVKK